MEENQQGAVFKGESELQRNKRNFMQKPKSSYKLHAYEAKRICEKYSEKHGIKMIFNGSTELGEKLLEGKKQREKDFFLKGIDSKDEQLDAFIKKIELSNMVLAHRQDNCLKLFVSSVFSNARRYISASKDEALYKKFKKMMKSTDCDNEDKDSMTNQLKKYKQEYIEVVNEYLEGCNLELGPASCYQALYGNKKMNDEGEKVCKDLWQNDLILEINDVQARLKDNEFVGYLYTNGILNGCKHFDALLLNKTKIIQLIAYNGYCGERDNITVTKFNDNFHPQSDIESCGTLGLHYMKHLLKMHKNQEINLNNYLIANVDNTKPSIFIPHPKVLMYSQSGLYNQAINNFMLGQSSFDYKEKTYLLDTASYKVPESLKQSWTKEYNEMNEKRSTMDHSSGHNLYLAFTTYRMKNLAKSVMPKQQPVQEVQALKYLTENENNPRITEVLDDEIVPQPCAVSDDDRAQEQKGSITLYVEVRQQLMNNIEKLNNNMKEYSASLDKYSEKQKRNIENLKNRLAKLKHSEEVHTAVALQPQPVVPQPCAVSDDDLYDSDDDLYDSGAGLLGFSASSTENTNAKQSANNEKTQVGQTEERQVGHTEEQQVGQTEERQVGHTEEQQVGHTEEQQVGQTEERQVGQTEEQQVGQTEEQQVEKESFFKENIAPHGKYAAAGVALPIALSIGASVLLSFLECGLNEYILLGLLGGAASFGISYAKTEQSALKAAVSCAVFVGFAFSGMLATHLSMQTISLV